MARPTNRQILTKGGDIYARKKAKKNAVEEVKFDEDARTEYLTGFHKRKLQRKETAQQKAKELEHQKKLEERRKIRSERLAKQEKELEKFNKAMKDITEYRDSSDEDVSWSTSTSENRKKKTRGSDDSDFSDWEGFDVDETTKPILKRQSSFVDDDGEDTTVVVQEMAEQFVDLSKSEEVLQESMHRAKQAALVSGMEQAAPSKRKKVKEKKFRYLTKQERNMHRSKQMARHKSKGRR